MKRPLILGSQLLHDFSRPAAAHTGHDGIIDHELDVARVTFREERVRLSSVALF
jgi:hypothetical protein